VPDIQRSIVLTHCGEEGDRCRAIYMQTRCWNRSASAARAQPWPAQVFTVVRFRPFSRRNAVGVTPINFLNTRFSWDASLIKLDYFDAGPSNILVQSQTADEGNFAKFRTLHGGSIQTVGSSRWETSYVNLQSKDLAWYVGPDYQKYHLTLLKKLFELTGERIFEVYRARWQQYLGAHTDVDAESRIDVQENSAKECATRSK
jgi:hypothetical protein